MNDRGSNGRGSWRIQVRPDTAKLTNVILTGFGERCNLVRGGTGSLSNMKQMFRAEWEVSNEEGSDAVFSWSSNFVMDGRSRTVVMHTSYTDVSMTPTMLNMAILQNRGPVLRENTWNFAWRFYGISCKNNYGICLWNTSCWPNFHATWAKHIRKLRGDSVESCGISTENFTCVFPWGMKPDTVFY